MEIIELTREWGVRIVGCTNAETTLGDHDAATCGMTAAELILAGHEAADKILLRHLHTPAEGDGSFAAWNGGKYDQHRMSNGLFAASFRRRELTAEDGEIIEGEWESVQNRDVPAVLRLGIEEILDQASTAFIRELDTTCENAGGGR